MAFLLHIVRFNKTKSGRQATVVIQSVSEEVTQSKKVYVAVNKAVAYLKVKLFS